MVTLNPVKSLKKIEKYVNHQSAMANMLSEMTTRDITNEFNKELTLDPNHDYYMLHNHIKELKDKHLPIRYEKFHKHRHKKQTNGLHMGSYVLLDLEINCIWNIKDVLRTELNIIHWKTTFVFLIQF